MLYRDPGHLREYTVTFSFPRGLRASGMDTMIAVQNLTKKYGQLTAVDDVSFEVKQGEIVGLLGHNGAGKTTVMKVMTGFLEPTAGTISVGGVDVTEDRLKVQSQIGYMPENAPLYGEMLVQEYLQMMAELRSIPRGKRNEAIAEAVIATGLQQRLVQPLTQLSQGYRQRVGLAQAILHKPKVLVLDEPTNGLDPVQIVEIRELIRRLGETATVILSTHILPEIEAVCDRAVILIDGHLAADAQLTDMLSTNRVRLRILEPVDITDAMNALPTVSNCRRVGNDSFGHIWLMDSDDPGQAVGPVTEIARASSWTVTEVGRETPRLETVFRDLMADHVQRSLISKEEAS